MPPIERPWQILVDCPLCLTEGAIIELMDPAVPACHLGQPAERRCRMCGFEERAAEEPFGVGHAIRAGRCPACRHSLSEEARTGAAPCGHCGYRPRLEPTAPGLPVEQPAVARARLQRWADDEGEPDVERFCQANMGLSLDALVARYAAGQPVATSFEVIAFLFPAARGGALVGPEPADNAREGAGQPGIPRPARPQAIGPPAPAPPSELPTTTASDPATAPDAAAPDPPTTAATPPRTEGAPGAPLYVRALIAVMAADGALRPAERQFVHDWAARQGFRIPREELRMWRPQELGPPPPLELRDTLIEAMVQLMHLDRFRDENEWKVITAYGRAWGVPLARLEALDATWEARYATRMSRFWAALNRLIRLRD